MVYQKDLYVNVRIFGRKNKKYFCKIYNMTKE